MDNKVVAKTFNQNDKNFGMMIDVESGADYPLNWLFPLLVNNGQSRTYVG